MSGENVSVVTTPKRKRIDVNSPVRTPLGQLKLGDVVRRETPGNRKMLKSFQRAHSSPPAIVRSDTTSEDKFEPVIDQEPAAKKAATPKKNAATPKKKVATPKKKAANPKKNVTTPKKEGTIERYFTKEESTSEVPTVAISAGTAISATVLASVSDETTKVSKDESRVAEPTSADVSVVEAENTANKEDEILLEEETDKENSDMAMLAYMTAGSVLDSNYKEDAVFLRDQLIDAMDEVDHLRSLLEGQNADHSENKIICDLREENARLNREAAEHRREAAELRREVLRLAGGSSTASGDTDSDL